MIEYPGLPRDYVMEMVHRFYDEYYFRPKAIFRIVRKAVFNTDERKRLYKEAKSFMTLAGSAQPRGQGRPQNSGHADHCRLASREPAPTAPETKIVFAGGLKRPTLTGADRLTLFLVFGGRLQSCRNDLFRTFHPSRPLFSLGTGFRILYPGQPLGRALYSWLLNC